MYGQIFSRIFFENNTSHLVAKTSWQKVFVAKKFREIFFENNTIHLHGKIFVAKKILWQKHFAKNSLKTILFTFVAKNFRGKKIFVAKKFSWQKNFGGKKISRNTIHLRCKKFGAKYFCCKKIVAN